MRDSRGPAKFSTAASVPGERALSIAELACRNGLAVEARQLEADDGLVEEADEQPSSQEQGSRRDAGRRAQVPHRLAGLEVEPDHVALVAGHEDGPPRDERTGDGPRGQGGPPDEVPVSTVERVQDGVEGGKEHPMPLHDTRAVDVGPDLPGPAPVALLEPDLEDAPIGRTHVEPPALGIENGRRHEGRAGPESPERHPAGPVAAPQGAVLLPGPQAGARADGRAGGRPGAGGPPATTPP